MTEEAQYVPWIINIRGKQIEGLYVILAFLFVMMILIFVVSYMQGSTNPSDSCNTDCRGAMMMFKAYNETGCFCLNSSNELVQLR